MRQLSGDAPATCQCHCGKTRFTAGGRPLLRFYCHCRICQAFNQAAYADVTVFLKRDLRLPADLPVQFRTHRLPPNVQRGICVHCRQPALELLGLGPVPGLAIIPSANFQDDDVLPDPALHIFYHRRQTDVRDALPKYRGYWRSQAALGKSLVRGLWR